jgi:hypothetical protein
VTASLAGVLSCPRRRYSGLVTASLAGVSSCPCGRYSGCQRAWREWDVTTQSYSGECPTESDENFSVEYLLMIFEASSFSASPVYAYAHPFSQFRAVSCLGSLAVAAVVGLFRGVLLDGVVSLSAEWRPALGMKGLDRVCSTGFGEGAIIVGVVYVFSGRPAGPRQEAATRFSFAVLA